MYQVASALDQFVEILEDILTHLF